jgi:GAF domain-containing protein
LLLDNAGLLRNGYSPHLPEDYLRAIDGIKPHPQLGTCAAAAATGEVVVTPDFCADSKWAELKHLPLSIGYKGAWSIPMKNAENKVIGTFGVYTTIERIPTEKEIAGTCLLAHTIAEVICQKKHRLDASCT